MVRVEELRMIVQVSRMYFEKGMRQPQIADKLGLSQSMVSRLLARAKEEDIVRISVSVPEGVYTELEEELVKEYGLQDAIVVDCGSEDDEHWIQKEIGAMAAYSLESVIKQNEVIGISSWSSTLLALVDAMHPLQNKTGISVVQILGGVGSPSARTHANWLTSRFADLVNGTSVFLPAPGIVGSAAASKILMEDIYVQQAINLFDHITIALVGIGAVEPSPLLAESGNIFSAEELEMLRKNGAVGDVLLRFFDANGKPVETDLNNRVISMNLYQLSRVHRAIGIAGGSRKFEAIRGALRGRLLNVLITDRYTASRLIREPQ